jgi:hypothetical protein
MLHPIERAVNRLLQEIIGRLRAEAKAAEARRDFHEAHRIEQGPIRELRAQLIPDHDERGR